MDITILCDNPSSWIIPYIHELHEELENKGYIVRIIDHYKKLEAGEVAFFLGCEKIIPIGMLKKNKHNLVVHESDLPAGKGWSPVTWQVLEGRKEIMVSLFEAVEQVDAGDIYLQDKIVLDGSELLEEIKFKQWEITRKLILEFLAKYPNIKPREQMGDESFYPRRTAKDSEVDINKTINEQFQLLRVVDNKRYPAFFYKDGQKYIIKIYKG